MSHWSIGFWLFLLVGLRALLHLLQVPGAHDAYGLVVIAGVLAFLISNEPQHSPE